MNSIEVKKRELKFCPKCGASIKEGSVFCENCGFDLSKRGVKEKKAPKKGVKINPKMIAGIAIVAVVAIAVIFVTSGGEEKEETPAPTTTPPTTTPSPTTAPPTTTPTTTVPPTTTSAPPTSAPPTSAPPTSAPPTAPPTSAPKYTVLTGGMNEPLDDGRMYVIAWSVTKSYRGWQPGGYFVEVFIQNVAEDEVQWKPIEMKVIDSSGKSHGCTVENSFILTGTEEELSVIEQIFGTDEGFRLYLNFETGMYLPQTFILTNEYSDGSTTTWEIRLQI